MANPTPRRFSWSYLLYALIAIAVIVGMTALFGGRT
jgi:hypothetical protein